jgi:hypothetical protein
MEQNGGFVMKLKPIYDGCGECDCSDFSYEINEIWLCPKCNEPIKKGNNCTECKQKIDWDMEENNE